MAKKTNAKILWNFLVVVGLVIDLCACSRSFITGINSFSAGATSSYSGATFNPQPSFTFAGNASNGDTVDDSVSLAAYSDSACSVLAPGTLTATQNPLPVKTFSGSFSGVSYACANHLEETVYVRAKSINAAICSTSVVVSQHFSAGNGYVVDGTTGAAGGTAGGERDQITAFAIDSSGRYVAAGSSKNAAGGTELALWRYNPDGTLDTTFGTTGEVFFGASGAAGASGASENDGANALAINSDGYIVVAGFSVNASGGKELAFWRYTSTGTLDTTLNSLGYVVDGTTGAAGGTGAGESDAATSLILDSSGNFVMGGFSENAAGGFQAVVWRYTSGGILDTTFNTTGILSFGSPGAAGGTGAGEADLPTAMRTDSTSHYILAGTSKNASGGVEQTIWRFDTAGTIDSTFGSGTGAVTFGTTGAAGGTGAGEDDLVNDLELDSAGNYVIAGSSKNAGGGFEFAIWRYTNSGSLDTTFNSSGVVVNGTTGVAGGSAGNEKDAGTSLKFDGTGRLMIVGASENGSHGLELAIWRYTNSGSLDSTFNSTGFVIFGATGAAGATGASEDDTGTFLMIDSKGRFVVSGSSFNSGGGQEAAMWRYLSTGILEI